MRKHFVLLGIVMVLALAGVGLAQAQHSVTLTWNASTTPNVTYNVYRSGVTGGPYTEINVNAVTTLNYMDTNVTAGATYFYVVRSFDGTNESINSNEAKAVVPQAPQPPSALSGIAK